MGRSRRRPRCLPSSLTSACERKRRKPFGLRRSCWLEERRGLEASERAAFLALEDRLPVSFTVIDLAWFAADGQRTLADIALVLEAEGWSVPVTDLEALFEHTARLGASTWAGEDGLREPGRDRV